MSKSSRGNAWGPGLTGGGRANRIVSRAFEPRALAAALAFLLTGAAAPAVVTAGEADDLQAMIDRARNGVTDLDRLDEKGAAKQEIGILRTWLNEAWTLRSEQKYDDVRVVLDRCDAQAEMIRQKTLAAKAMALAAEKEARVAKLRADIEKARRGIEETKQHKATLEARTK